MPGVFENTNENIPNSNISNEPDVEVAEQNTGDANEDVEPEPNQVLDEQPVRELTQTDKINRFMLKSFLEHMNNQLSNQQFTASGHSVEDESQEDNEWWNRRSSLCLLCEFIRFDVLFSDVILYL